MAVNDTPEGEVEQNRIDAPIPSILTTSAVEMLETFTTDIVKIKARGSHETRNGDSLMREFGLDWTQTQRHEVTLDYRQIREREEGKGIVVQNPLTEAAVDNLIHELRLRLRPDADVEPDLTVDKLVLDATLPSLQDSTRAMSSGFELTFVSDPAHSTPGDTRGARSLTREKNRDRGLYSELSWNIRNLNLRCVEETKVAYPEQGDGRIMSWQGPGDTRINSPKEVASTIKEKVCPDDYAAMKRFGVSDENDTELQDISL
jgi:hypothetical protein